MYIRGSYYPCVLYDCDHSWIANCCTGAACGVLIFVIYATLLMMSTIQQSAVLVLYDHVTTLSREIYWIWGRDWTSVTKLFYLSEPLDDLHMGGTERHWFLSLAHTFSECNILCGEFDDVYCLNSIAEVCDPLIVIPKYSIPGPAIHQLFWVELLFRSSHPFPLRNLGM